MVGSLIDFAEKLARPGNLREPKCCLGLVFNFKLGCLMCTIAWPIQSRPSLESKTRPRFCPVIFSLSMPGPNNRLFCRSNEKSFITSTDCHKTCLLWYRGCGLIS